MEKLILLPHNNQITTVTMYLDINMKPIELSLNTDRLQHHTNQHLYVISSKEEPKNGDWCIEMGILENFLVQFDGNSECKCFKIIKTTDESLNLPIMSKMMLEAYVTIYNRDNFGNVTFSKLLDVGKLSFNEQIDILTRAKFRIENKLNSGVCLAIDDSLIDSGRKMVYHINTVIPLFSRASALIACNEKEVELPKITDSFWWDLDNSESRIAFLDWMIEKLQTEIKK